MFTYITRIIQTCVKLFPSCLKRKGGEQDPHGRRQNSRKSTRKPHLSFSHWYLLCVGASCWFKAPVKRRISKGLQATRRAASRVTTQQPPSHPPTLLLTSLNWLPASLSTPSDLPVSFHQLSPPSPLTRPHLWLHPDPQFQTAGWTHVLTILFYP